MVQIKKGVVIEEEEGGIQRFLRSRKNQKKLTVTEGMNTIGNRRGSKSFHRIKGSARDVRTSNLSQEERNSLVKDARAKGFNAIDEGDHIHIDVGQDQRKTSGKDRAAFGDVIKEDKRGIFSRGKDATDAQRELNNKFADEITSLDGILDQKEKERAEDDITSHAAATIQGEQSLEVRQVQSAALLQTDSAQRKVASAAQNDMPENVRRVLVQDMQNPEKVAQSVQRSKQSKLDGSQSSLKDNFLDAVTFFLPTAIGALVGSVEGSEGALRGAQAGTSLGGAFREHQMKKEELGITSSNKEAKLKRQQAQDELAQDRLDISQGQLEARQKDIKLAQDRSSNLEEDRDLRREERDADRAIKLKEQFVKRKDVIASKDQFELLSGMEDIIKDAPEIAAGVIPFKMAKGLAGEVGNLTNEEREAAQISPSFYRKLSRDGAAFFKGKLPEEDVTELKKVLKAIRSNVNSRVKQKVENYAKSRGKTLKGENQKFLLEDLLSENLSVNKEKSKESTPSVDVKTQLEIIKRIKARRK